MASYRTLQKNARFLVVATANEPYKDDARRSRDDWEVRLCCKLQIPYTELEEEKKRRTGNTEAIVNNMANFSRSKHDQKIENLEALRSKDEISSIANKYLPIAKNIQRLAGASSSEEEKAIREETLKMAYDFLEEDLNERQIELITQIITNLEKEES